MIWLNLVRMNGGFVFIGGSGDVIMCRHWSSRKKFSLFPVKSHGPSRFHQAGYFLLGLPPKFAVRSTKYCGLIIIYYLLFIN